MNFTKWKAGIGISALYSALTAGAAFASGVTWRQLLVIFCATMLTHGAAYLTVPGDGNPPTKT